MRNGRARGTIRIIGLAVAVGLLSLATGCGSEEESGDLLYVQAGGPGTFEKQPDGSYALTMTDVRSHVSFFADRPERTAGTLSMGELFHSVFDDGDPPNAALAMDLGDDRDTIVPVELLAPDYDASLRRLTYAANLLPEGSEDLPGFDYADASRGLPSSFVRADLFIDNGKRTLHDTCYSSITTSWDLNLVDADPAAGDRHYAALPQTIYASDGEGNFQLAYQASHGFLGAESDGGTHASLTYDAVSGNAPYDKAVVHLHCNINGAYPKDSYCYTYQDATPKQHQGCRIETGSDGYGGTSIQFNLP
jgi:hypothetical protein